MVAGVAFGFLVSASRQADKPAAVPEMESPLKDLASSRKLNRQEPSAKPPTAAPAPQSSEAKQEKPDQREVRKLPVERPSAPQPPARKAPLRRGLSERVALTFDAGAAAEPGWDILKTLRERGLKCTFFITGKFARNNPQLVKAIAADGHEIGNHTWGHPDLRKLSDQEIREELSKTEFEVQEAAGVSTKPFFRPPFGARDKRVLRVAREEGYECVYWTVDSWDSVKKGITADEIIDRVTGLIKSDGVILCHIGSRASAEALPRLLDDLQAMGLTPVKVSELEGSIPK